MKKTLLSVIIASAASSVSAIEVYNENGTSVKLNGEVKAHWRADRLDDRSDEYLKGRQTGQFNTDGKLVLNGETKLNDVFNVGGALTVEGNQDDDVKVTDKLLFISNSHLGKMSFGKTDASYDVLEQTKVTNELDNFYSDMLDDSEERGVRYTHRIGNIDLSADYQSYESDQVFKGTQSASLGYSDDHFNIALVYSKAAKSNNQKATDSDVGLKLRGVVGGYKVSGFDFSAGVYEIEANIDQMDGVPLGVDVDGRVFNLAGSYQFDKTKFYTAFERVDFDVSRNKEYTIINNDTYTLGAEYQISKEFKVFAEGARKLGEMAYRYHKTELAIGGVYSF